MEKAYLEIYKKTQELAQKLANLDGWQVDAETFHSQHKALRVSNYFNKACEVMEMEHGHEMSDIVEEVESTDLGEYSQCDQLKAIHNLKEAVTFFEKVQAGSADDAVPVGTDHYEWLIKASKEVTQAF